MANAGKPAIPSKAIRNPPDSLYDGYMMAENVSGNIRIDMYDFDIEVPSPLNTRFCKIMDQNQARRFAILLIDAIDKAEIEEGRARKNKRKK